MKTKLLISLVLFLTLAAFIFKTPSENVNNNLIVSPPVSVDKEFLITVMNSQIDHNYQYFPQLGANAWHSYASPFGGWYGIPNDRYDVSGTVYGPYLVDKINLNRTTYGFRTIMDRPKTEYLIWGQRSDYQCEDISEGQDYWFYAYNTHQAGRDTNDYAFNGNGARVKYCQTIPGNLGSNAGYVAKDLRANREQANKQWNETQRDDRWKWYVMPRIRIDTSVLNINPNTKVCSIIMVDWNGVKIDSVDILADNFQKNTQNPYDGNYLEEYFFSHDPTAIPNAIEIDSGVICPGPARNFWDWSSIDSTNTIKTDFRVYWYGMCDMWIDYVRVENTPAHQLFKQTGVDWDTELKSETDFALTGYDPNNPIPNNFYIEEFEFNTVPCMKYVDSIITTHSDGKITLMANLNYSLFNVHTPHFENHELSAE